MNHTLKLHSRLQYRNAKALLAEVNEKRPPKEPYYRHCLNATAFACFIPIRILDWLRVSRFGRFLVKRGLVRDRSSSDVDVEYAYTRDRDMRREARVKARMSDANLTWTMSMAFYALCGGCVYISKTGEQRVLRGSAIAYLAKHEPQNLLQLQRVVLQNPGKANAIGKAITCVQAIWFCSQCIARLSGSLAVSLLELNTFAHCISALLIYIFWWDKPYDVEMHTFIESGSLDFYFLLKQADLSDVLKAPEVFLRPGPDETGRFSVAYEISDPDGNVLLCGEARIRFPCERPSIDHPEYVMWEMGSKIRIHDTGLHLSFECPTSVLACRAMVGPLKKDQWMSLWSAWIDSNRPVPASPFSRIETWFYQRTSGSPDLDGDIVRDVFLADLDPSIYVSMDLTFVMYGGLHLLAWQYNFNSESERYLWRISAVTTASTSTLR